MQLACSHSLVGLTDYILAAWAGATSTRDTQLYRVLFSSFAGSQLIFMLATGFTWATKDRTDEGPSRHLSDDAKRRGSEGFRFARARPGG